jgi:hypothetical protein
MIPRQAVARPTGFGTEFSQIQRKLIRNLDMGCNKNRGLEQGSKATAEIDDVS